MRKLGFSSGRELRHLAESKPLGRAAERNCVMIAAMKKLALAYEQMGNYKQAINQRVRIDQLQGQEGRDRDIVSSSILPQK